jgi:hypothetical protein
MTPRRRWPAPHILRARHKRDEVLQTCLAETRPSELALAS